MRLDVIRTEQDQPQQCFNARAARGTRRRRGAFRTRGAESGLNLGNMSGTWGTESGTWGTCLELGEQSLGLVEHVWNLGNTRSGCRQYLRESRKCGKPLRIGHV
eukprot:1192766-Rhodomonas_salina.1